GVTGAGEIAVILNYPDSIESIRAKVASLLPPEDMVLSWNEIRPDSQVAIQINAGMARLMTLILVFVAFVGVASAQLTSILERQTEFAVLSAIGMNTRRIVGLILGEALIMGTLSWLAIVAFAAPLVGHFAKVGFRVLSNDQPMSFVGTVIDPVF